MWGPTFDSYSQDMLRQAREYESRLQRIQEGRRQEESRRAMVSGLTLASCDTSVIASATLDGTTFMRGETNIPPEPSPKKDVKGLIAYFYKRNN